jgi:nitroimidazol reductase NimA-like FMN-containing flavoprotein (pyridoxamine 5'-phosphate oxidase superfamily)
VAGVPLFSDEARELLAQALSGCLGVVDEEGPYLVPISFAQEADRLYFHGGAGRKAAALERDPRVCLSVNSAPELVRGPDPCADNFDYRSVLVFGRARLLIDEDERQAGLRALARKYHPTTGEYRFRPETAARTLLYVLEVDRVSWKQHPR